MQLKVQGAPCWHVVGLLQGWPCVLPSGGGSVRWSLAMSAVVDARCPYPLTHQGCKMETLYHVFIFAEKLHVFLQLLMVTQLLKCHKKFLSKQMWCVTVLTNLPGVTKTVSASRETSLGAAPCGLLVWSSRTPFMCSFLLAFLAASDRAWKRNCLICPCKRESCCDLCPLTAGLLPPTDGALSPSGHDGRARGGAAGSGSRHGVPDPERADQGRPHQGPPKLSRP